MSYFPFFTSFLATFFLACSHHGFTSAAAPPKCCLYQQKEPTVMNLEADGYTGVTTLLPPLCPGARGDEGSSCIAIRGQTLRVGLA